MTKTTKSLNGLDTEIRRIRESYPQNSIHIVYDHEGGYWAVAISQVGASPGERVIAFGGSRNSLLEAVLDVKPVEPNRSRKPKGPSNG